MKASLRYMLFLYKNTSMSQWRTPSLCHACRTKVYEAYFLSKLHNSNVINPVIAIPVRVFDDFFHIMEFVKIVRGSAEIMRSHSNSYFVRSVAPI